MNHFACNSRSFFSKTPNVKKDESNRNNSPSRRYFIEIVVVIASHCTFYCITVKNT